MAKSKKKEWSINPSECHRFSHLSWWKYNLWHFNAKKYHIFLLERYKQRERETAIFCAAKQICAFCLLSQAGGVVLSLLGTCWRHYSDDINKVLCKCESHVFIVSAARPLSCLDFRILLGSLCCWHGSHSWWWPAGVLTKSFYLTLQN